MNVSMKLQAIAIMTFLTFMNVMAQETTKTTDMNTLELTQEWDKTFPQSDKVEHTKITFHNRYGITLAADLYKPKNVQGHLAAIAVSGPYGATKEQVSGRYAQTLAERGFLTIAFDPSYYGESGGTPRYLTSPEISTEDFSAAVDYLTSREDVDMERIGILGICGWGGFALNAAANDPRIKATVTSTMYDMSRVNANGYFDANDNADARYELRRQLNDIRTKAYRTGDDRVWMISPYAATKVRARVRVTILCQPGMVDAQYGWRGDQETQVMIPRKNWDPISGYPCCNDVCIEVVKADEEKKSA